MPRNGFTSVATMKRLALVSGFVVCLAALTPVSSPAPAVAGVASPIRLTVMSFNIQYGASFSTIDGAQYVERGYSHIPDKIDRLGGRCLVL